MCGPQDSDPRIPSAAVGSVVRLQENCPNPVLVTRSSEKEAPQGPQLRAPAPRARPGPVCRDKASGFWAEPSTDACLQPVQPGSRASILLRAAPVWVAPESHLPGFLGAQTPGHCLGHLS